MNTKPYDVNEKIKKFFNNEFVIADRQKKVADTKVKFCGCGCRGNYDIHKARHIDKFRVRENA